MTDTPWTPGPWRSDYLDRNGQRTVSAEHFEVCTCWHHSVGSIEKEMEANARLIAAAPDLFAALDAIIDGRFWSMSDDKFGAAKAALAKARGQA